MAYKSKEFYRRAEEEGSDTYYQSLGWVINKQISDLGVQTMMLAAEIDETFPNYSKKHVGLGKVQNTKAFAFRDMVRKLVYLSGNHLTKRRVTAAKEKVDRILELVDKPYGSYDLRDLTKLAREYYGLLVEYDIIPVAGYYQQDPLGMMRGQ